MTISEIRSFFPVLNQKVYDKPLIYFDSAAPAQKPVQVLMCEEKLHNDFYGNIHRGAHFMADKATVEFENVRTKVAEFINAPHREEIVFTKGTTDIAQRPPSLPKRLNFTRATRSFTPSRAKPSSPLPGSPR